MASRSLCESTMTSKREALNRNKAGQATARTASTFTKASLGTPISWGGRPVQSTKAAVGEDAGARAWAADQAPSRPAQNR